MTDPSQVYALTQTLTPPYGREPLCRLLVPRSATRAITLARTASIGSARS